MMQFRLFIFCLIVVLVYSNYTHAKQLTLGSINDLSEQEIGQIVLPQIYERLGIALEIRPLPAKRAEYHLMKGELDGEIMRIFEYGEEHTTLIRVPTPYYSVVTTAFVRKDSNIHLSSVDDLKLYSIVKIRGIKNTDLITQGLPNIAEEYDTASIMQLVIRGAADIALTNRVNGLLTLNQLGQSQVVAYPLSLKSIPVYHYLHKKHESLVPRVDVVIQSMLANGELETAIKDAEIKVIGGYKNFE